MGKRNRLSVSDFKAHALRIFSRVEGRGEEFDIVKRGKLIARVIPIVGTERKIPFDCCSDMGAEIGDVISPMGEDEWAGVR